MWRRSSKKGSGRPHQTSTRSGSTRAARGRRATGAVSEDRTADTIASSPPLRPPASRAAAATPSATLSSPPAAGLSKDAGGPPRLLPSAPALVGTLRAAHVRSGGAPHTPVTAATTAAAPPPSQLGLSISTPTRQSASVYAHLTPADASPNATEEGYYVVVDVDDDEDDDDVHDGGRFAGQEGSDDSPDNSSLNSSFADTPAAGAAAGSPRRARLSSPQQTLSRRPSQRDEVGARGSGGLRGPPHPSHLNGALPHPADCPIAEEDDMDMEDYDEEDEEMAVKRYMDEGAAHSRVTSGGRAGGGVGGCGSPSPASPSRVHELVRQAVHASRSGHASVSAPMASTLSSPLVSTGGGGAAGPPQSSSHGSGRQPQPPKESPTPPRPPHAQLHGCYPPPQPPRGAGRDSPAGEASESSARVSQVLGSSTHRPVPVAGRIAAGGTGSPVAAAAATAAASPHSRRSPSFSGAGFVSARSGSQSPASPSPAEGLCVHDRSHTAPPPPALPPTAPAATTSHSPRDSALFSRSSQVPLLPLPPAPVSRTGAALAAASRSTAGSHSAGSLSSPTVGSGRAVSTDVVVAVLSSTPRVPSTAGSHASTLASGPSPTSASPPAGARAAAASPYGRLATAAACRSLSLHEAFFLNAAGTAWVVDDLVLAKCLEFVRLMGYQHPQLRRDQAAGRADSIWGSAAAIATPLVRSVAVGEEGLSGSDGYAPPTYRLRRHPPFCAADHARTPTHFLSCAEAMRWVQEREYVIGAILLCCAHADPAAGATAGRGRHTHPHSPLTPTATATTTSTDPDDGSVADASPAIPVTVHPIQWVAQHLLTSDPLWGDFSAFAQVWERQVWLTLGTASPGHQRVFHNRQDGLTFHSDFEGGNLLKVEKGLEPYAYNISLEPDKGSDTRLWFRFAVCGVHEGRTLRLRLLNAAPHTKLYRENGMRPVFHDGATVPNWTAVDQCTFRTINGDTDGELSFAILVRSSASTIQIAFCVPYTYADLLCHLCHWHALVRASVCAIRFEEHVYGSTPDGRKQHLLLITSQTSQVKRRNGKRREKSMCDEGGSGAGGGPAKRGSKSGGGDGEREVVRGPYANFESGKKVVLISGRVHPGEVTASHAVHGLISFLLSADPRAVHLREHFLFFIVPMLNPDGVSRGHSRLDQFGNNLNRCYNTPDPETQPTVSALCQIFRRLQRKVRERFIMYLDFHSHASQSSGFMFGNHLPPSVHHWNLVYPKVVELHARDGFSFTLCRFGRAHMLSKEGASRVLFGETLIHSYTVELPHFTNRILYADTFAALNNGGGVMEDEAARHVGGGAPRSLTPIPAPEEAAAVKSVTTRDAGRPVGARESGRHTPASAVKRSSSEGLGARGGALRRGPKVSVTPAAAAAALVARGTPISAGRGSPAAAMGSPSSPSETAGSLAASPTSPASPTLTKRVRRQLACESGAQAPALQPIAQPSILVQSAAVGRACVLALLDYCAAGTRLSPELTSYGGMERVLGEVKRAIKMRERASFRKGWRPGRGGSGYQLTPLSSLPQTYQQMQEQFQLSSSGMAASVAAQMHLQQSATAAVHSFRQY